ncbi:MAG TPA: IS1182 family transposase [Acidimicrobiaceae bacterium]|nr:IS1182 family transposase [Acidimicrobiaceae bacterium]|tara:strand:+ start:134 stop:1669 length:1536 start_codon:yes stop_codon:yes gene_type:complete
MQGSSDQDRELLDAGALVGHLVPEGSVHRFLADHRHRLFPDAMFEDLFPSKRGRPSVPADVIATVMVLQALEGRSDREAIDALRTDLRWKVAAGLALDDEGFHPTVLTLWRNKLRASESPERIFDAVRAVVAETGVLAGKTRRALDSTLLDDAVATQDTVTQLVSMIRRARKAIPAAASVEVSAHDYDSPGKPACAWDDPAARDELITRLVNDALTILAALEGVDLDEQQQQLVALLALVAGQDVEPDPERGAGSWRIVRGVASERVISTVDPESRHMHKSRSSYRDGYKAHLAVEPDTGIITGCDLTPANTGDGPVGARLLADEDPGLDVLADSAYGSGPVRAALADGDHTVIIKPWPLARNPKLDHDQFHRDDFTVDYTARTVTCPAGQTVSITPAGNAIFGPRCRSCPLRHRCTSSTNGRKFDVSDHDELLAAARNDWRAGTHLADYRQHRPMVERTIAWLVANGHRRVRFRGVERNRLGLSHRAAALNLRRLLNLGLHHGPTGWAIT